MTYDLHQLFFDIGGSNSVPVWGKKTDENLPLTQVLNLLAKKADAKEWEVHVFGDKQTPPVRGHTFLRRHKGANLADATIVPTRHKWSVILGGNRLGDFEELDAALRHGIEETRKLLPDKPVFATPDGDDWSIRALIPGLNAEGHESATVFKVPA